MAGVMLLTGRRVRNLRARVEEWSADEQRDVFKHEHERRGGHVPEGLLDQREGGAQQLRGEDRELALGLWDRQREDEIECKRKTWERRDNVRWGQTVRRAH